MIYSAHKVLEKGTQMIVLLSMPIDVVDTLKSFGFDAFWNIARQEVQVDIEPSNAIELERLAQVLQQYE